MSENDIKQTIQRNVLARVRGGSVHMRSRAYFVMRVITTATLGILTLALSAIVLSFIAFSIHESGEQFLLGYGARGVTTFLMLFPWATFLADVAILFVLEWLLQGFKWGYRVSLLSVFIGVFLTSATLAGLVDLTPIHQVLLDSADNGTLPIAGELYESVRASHEDQGIFKGTVMSISGGEMTIAHDDADHDADDGTRTVSLPPGAPAPQVGDRVYVYGRQSGDHIQAYGIDMLSPDQ